MTAVLGTCTRGRASLGQLTCSLMSAVELFHTALRVLAALWPPVGYARTLPEPRQHRLALKAARHCPARVVRPQPGRAPRPLAPAVPRAPGAAGGGRALADGGRAAAQRARVGPVGHRVPRGLHAGRAVALPGAACATGARVHALRRSLSIGWQARGRAWCLLWSFRMTASPPAPGLCRHCTLPCAPHSFVTLHEMPA